MSYEFRLPDLGEGVREGEIARWLVEVGQEISEDDPLVEVQTDKTTVEIPSPAGGRVGKILVGEGEVVPVIRSADTRPLDELDAEAERLADGARESKLDPEELRGSTFTVTSAGRLGGLFATPLVNHPEVAILGLHRIAPRPMVVAGEIVAREVGWLSCTFDHRVVDGARASEF